MTAQLANITDGDSNVFPLFHSADGQLVGGINADGGIWSFTSFLASGLGKVRFAAAGDIGNNRALLLPEPPSVVHDPRNNCHAQKQTTTGPGR